MADILYTGLILIAMISVLYLSYSIFSFLMKNHISDKQIMEEFEKIEEGDIYECKNEVNSSGVSRTNPFEQLRYRVIRKKEGWVELKKIDNSITESPLVHAPVKEILKKKYKYIGNFNKNN